MSVYVDEMSLCMISANWPYAKSCHLAADSVAELQVFARKIGLHRSWFQNKPELPHYDLTYGMRVRAVAYGAIEVDRNKISDLMKQNRSRSAGQ